ncbi:hypothetical protein [Psychrobacter sp. I-STPA6b]|uniref:hypothetical protein n=1 Tax=Psychrobacter sp. I-STPA6b TaxID=2585718 RepID=UPI001D0C807F|nr:hypothetical protein [Psychrobacter sp. I-STPA6b]
MKKFLFTQLLRHSIVSVALAAPLTLATMMSASAAMDESQVYSYASAMKQAANSKNIAMVDKLVSDDALISMSRRGKTTSLNKNAYLKLLQDSWDQTSNYHYDISVSNIVTSGNQAKADVKTVESWVKNGQPTTLTTSSRATLVSTDNNAVLLRAVAQVTIE